MSRRGPAHARERRPSRAILGGALCVLLVACDRGGEGTEAPGAAQGAPAVRSRAELVEQLPPLPPLEQLEAPVRRQFEERHDLLDRTLQNPQADASDLAWALGQMGRLHQAYRHLDAALWFLEAAHEQAPTSFEWAYVAGHLHKVLGNFSAARTRLEAARELRPDQAVVWAALAAVAVASGRPERGREHYEKALELDPAMVVARYELALLDLAEGHAADAAIALEKLLEEQPLAYQLHHAMGDALKKLGRPEEAASRYRNVPESPTRRVGLQSDDPWLESIQDLPVSATALERKGRQALLRGYWEVAADLFRRARAIAPHRPEIRFNLAMAYFSSGKIEQAAPELEQLIEDVPTYSSSYRLLGRILAIQGRDPEALRYLRHAVELDPESEAHHRALADFHLQRGRTTEARRHFREAERLDDRGAEAFLGLAQCLLLDGENEAAMQAVEQGLRRQPLSKTLRWLALRARALQPKRFGPAFPNPPRSIFELESAAMSRAADGDFTNAAGLQGAALEKVLASPTRVPATHLRAVRLRLERYQAGAVPTTLWAVGELPRVTLAGPGYGRRSAASGSPSRRR
ncbi:MAG: tetratricopeptide repeat protein [Holophagales bacterium]|nr:tetratricopeptide repeat protein [Holophagales bacterium]